ncbi:MAG: DUF4040 domain-containing protein [Spirochaetaceae bacterium]|nr:MAG: DUF4040 domain-containing protein [Spirochaetaceae bacterium]
MNPNLIMNLESVLSIMLLGATIAVVFSRNMINAVIGCSVFSMFLTLKYFTLNAPDVAITEAALGAGLSTLVFLVAIHKTSGRSPAAKQGTPAEDPQADARGRDQQC